MEYLPQFKLWLSQKRYSDSTIKNYLADLGKYLVFVNSLPQNISLDLTSSQTNILSPEIVSLYSTSLKINSSAARYLSSLNLFCQFALDQHLISQNPLKKSTEVTPQDLVNLWAQSLTHQKASPSTIKNYLNDLTQYISWLNLDPR